MEPRLQALIGRYDALVNPPQHEEIPPLVAGLLVVADSVLLLRDAVIDSATLVTDGPPPVPSRPGLPDWEDAVGLAKAGRTTWPLRHVEGGRELVPWPVEWTCAEAVAVSEAHPLGFREVRSYCLYSGRLVGLMNTTDVATYGCRCARCGVVMATQIDPNLNGLLTQPGIPSCVECRAEVDAVEALNV